MSGPRVAPASARPRYHIVPSYFFANIAQFLACQHSSILAMNSNNPSPAFGALILVPIVIAGSAAFLAIKAPEVYTKTAGLCIRGWKSCTRVLPWTGSKQSRKIRRSDSFSAQVYADSWVDLESNHSDRVFSTFIGQSPVRKANSDGSKDESVRSNDTPRRIWHPSRSTRLMWSFGNPRSQSPNPFESSNAVRPLPVARLPARGHEDVISPALPMRVREVRRMAQTDL